MKASLSLWLVFLAISCSQRAYHYKEGSYEEDFTAPNDSLAYIKAIHIFYRDKIVTGKPDDTTNTGFFTLLNSANKEVNFVIDENIIRQEMFQQIKSQNKEHYLPHKSIAR